MLLYLYTHLIARGMQKLHFIVIYLSYFMIFFLSFFYANITFLME